MIRAFAACFVLVTAVLLSIAAQAFSEQDREKLSIRGECPDCDLSGADLSGGSFHGADFSRANLRGANLTDAVLVDANLQAANLSASNLSGASMGNAALVGADLTGAVLSNADISGADLGSAVGLTQAQLDQTCDHGSEAPKIVVLPAGLRIRPCFQ